MGRLISWYLWQAKGDNIIAQYFHGQNLIIAWVNSFVHRQNHFSMGKFIWAWANLLLALAIWFEHEQTHLFMGTFLFTLAIQFIFMLKIMITCANQGTLLHAQTFFCMVKKPLFMVKISLRLVTRWSHPNSFMAKHAAHRGSSVSVDQTNQLYY